MQFHSTTVAAIGATAMLATTFAAAAFTSPALRALRGAIGRVPVLADSTTGDPGSEPALHHSFRFTRAVYTDRGEFDGWKDWRTDYPKADRQFLVVLRRLVRMDARLEEHVVALDDPALRFFPFLYAVEVGQMDLTEAEVDGLRNYLLAGGFLVVDDFWGSREWRQFERQMERVFPEFPIREIPLDHPVFHTYYDIDRIQQMPNVGQVLAGGPSWEQDGYEPHLRGIFDSEGRLMVAISWNNDLGDAWEWAEHPRFPLELSTFAYQMGVNLVVYAMSH